MSRHQIDILKSHYPVLWRQIVKANSQSSCNPKEYSNLLLLSNKFSLSPCGCKENQDGNVGFLDLLPSFTWECSKTVPRERLLSYLPGEMSLTDLTLCPLYRWNYLGVNTNIPDYFKVCWTNKEPTHSTSWFTACLFGVPKSS